jgi:hypothetical protein
MISVYIVSTANVIYYSILIKYAMTNTKLIALITGGEEPASLASSHALLTLTQPTVASVSS